MIHVAGEYDYRFEVGVTDEVFDALKACFYYQTKEQLPIFALPENLKIKDFARTKKDAQKAISKLPPKHYRVYTEIAPKDLDYSEKFGEI